MKILQIISSWIKANITIVVILVISLMIIGLYLDVRSASFSKDQEINKLIKEAQRKDKVDDQYRQKTNKELEELNNLNDSQHSGLDTLIDQLKQANIVPSVDESGHSTVNTTTTTTTIPHKQSAPGTTQSPNQSPPPSSPPSTSPPPTSPSSPPTTTPPSPPPSNQPQPPPPLPPLPCIGSLCLR